MAGQGVSWQQRGADAINADISPESVRRHDENAATIVRLKAEVERRGARLLLCWLKDDDYNWYLGARLAARVPDLPNVSLTDYLPEGGTLGFDAHPNPTALQVFGTWLAADLLARGWITPGAGAPLPEVPAAWAERRSHWPEPAELLERGRQGRTFQRELLQPEIDFVSGRGLNQVFGGLNRDLSARTRMLVLLAHDGEQLRVGLEPLAGCPDLYPLRVDVEVDGEGVGEVIVPKDGPGWAMLRLPPAKVPERPIEVGLTQADFTVVRDKAHGRVASFRPLFIGCRPH
jgi:hypothetical protein